MVFTPFNNLSELDKTNAVEKMVSQSTPSNDFFFMMTLAVLMATFGVLIDSIAVVIGSMLIAPLLSPILSLSLGVILADMQLVSRSLRTVGKSVGLALIASAVITLLFGQGAIPSGVIDTLEPSFLYMGIAIVAGFAASFALVKPKMNETLPGVVIAVTLIPPLALMGVGAAKWNAEIVSDAFLVFLLNAVGIVFASMITFSLMNFYVKRRVARDVVREEDGKLVEEQLEAQENNHDR